jgi:hypothetical protein
MNTNNRHDASGQMVGYLYQALSALLLLLESTESQTQICIEKFDDVTFGEDVEPSTRIQIKHQLFSRGNLNDTSVDLWRTISNWCDVIETSTCNLAETKFIIITTASVKEDSAVSHLTDFGNRDCDTALKILRNTAETNAGKTNEKFYQTFSIMKPLQQENLVKRMYVYGGAPKIDGLKDTIMRFVRCGTLSKHEDTVYDKIVGWWFSRVIECLCSPTPVFISREQLQRVMFDIGSEYKADSLPIDVDASYNPTQDEVNGLSSDNQMFIAQLRLIAISPERKKRCIKDYYNAFQQRSRWVREQLIFVDELSKYDKILTDEWDRLFLIMKEKLEDYGIDVNDKQKENAGRELLNEIEQLNILIRERVTQPFIMRGTFHGLADKFDIGWHVEFRDRLCHLLKGQ